MKNITIKSLRAEQKNSPENSEDFFEKPKNELEDFGEEKRSRSKFKRLVNFVFLFIFVLTVGGVGGVLIDRFAIPHLFVRYPQLNQYEFLKRMNERTIIVEVIKEIKITEDEAVIEAIKNALPSTVQIIELTEASGGKVEEFKYKGTGVILTSDGFIAVALESLKIVAEEETISKKEEVEDDSNLEINNSSNVEKDLLRVKLNNEKTYLAKLIAEDVSTGFAIIKIDEANLPVLAFAVFDDLELGEKIIILDNFIAVDVVSKFVLGAVNGEIENTQKIKIMNSLDKSFNGAPVVNLKGEVIGVSQGGDLIVPIDKIMALVDEATNK